VRGELGRMSAAAPGERNQVAYRVACRLIELCMADWAHLDLDEVQRAYLGACEQANAPTADGPLADQFLDGEAWACWFSAQRKVREPAALPTPDFMGTPWSPPVFPPGLVAPGIIDTSTNPDSARTAPGQVGGQADFDQAGQDPANPFVSPGAVRSSMDVAGESINGPSEQDIQALRWEQAVTEALSRLLVRREAERRLSGFEAVRTDFHQVALDDAGMAALPQPVPLIDGWLDRDILARVNGPSGHGKSFVVLDMAACVSTGLAWHGRSVERVRVCYIVAEGARGTAARARAWCERHDVESTGITFLPRPVQIGGPEWPALVAYCTEQQFGLVILDTQARSTVGLDENDATEMGQAVAGLDEIRAATGACAMLVHHRGARGDHGRGSTAVRGAMDVELDVSRQGTTITLKSTKQKDRDDPAPLRFTMTQLSGSVVLVGEDEGMGPFTSPGTAPMSLRERCSVAIAFALLDASGSGLTRAEAQAHARVALNLGADEGTRRIVRRGWADLVGLGRIAKAAGREAYFFIELDGEPVLAANPGKLVSGGPEVYVP
jgi:hypothetical protein